MKERECSSKDGLYMLMVCGKFKLLANIVHVTKPYVIIFDAQKNMGFSANFFQFFFSRAKLNPRA
jgi:hypothetical protein